MTKAIEELLLSDFGKALKQVCKDQADSDLHNHEVPALIDDVWTEEDRERLAADYLKIAITQLEYVTAGETGWDPWLVVRAVEYVGVFSPAPHTDLDPTWFRHALQVVTQIACPCTAIPPGGEPFFNDLRAGMNKSEAWGA